MSAIGLVLNVLTLVISTAVVILFRIIDRDNRSLDKLKRYAANLQDEIDGMVDKSIQELKNTALDLEVNARAGRELLDDVSREDSRLTEIQNRIDGLENSVKNSETAMDQLSRLTQSVEENMRNLRRESDFVTAVAKKVKEYLWEHPANYNGQVDALLELLYYAFAEYNTVETPEFKEQTDPLKEKLRALADTEQEADEYMDIVFALCAAYERQGYIEGIKVGMRLVIEMVEG